jgi:hypothetical protein
LNLKKDKYICALNNTPMKKYFITALILVFAGLSAFAINIPAAVTDAFAKKFPGALNVKWGKENAKEYEAEFKLNGKSVSANFLADGSWVETESEIAPAALPVKVADAINAKKPGATILKSFKIETAKGETTYEAEIRSGNKKSEMIIKADGTFVK